MSRYAFVCILSSTLCLLIFFFFNDTATTEIYTLSLHDALPICGPQGLAVPRRDPAPRSAQRHAHAGHGDRKSTRLNSSHGYISYAVFCLKKKKNIRDIPDSPTILKVLRQHAESVHYTK